MTPYEKIQNLEAARTEAAKVTWAAYLAAKDAEANAEDQDKDAARLLTAEKLIECQIAALLLHPESWVSHYEK